MAELTNRPELPEIFPQTDVTVEGEEHRFKVRQLDYSTEPQYEYVLDKAPVGAVQSIQGVDQDGDSRTFSNGVDYELVSKTDTVQDEFTYMMNNGPYLLRYQHDVNTDIVSDQSGDTYVNGTDYRIIDSDGHYGDTLEWIEDGATPDNNEAFTVVYDVTFPSSVVQWQEDADNIPQADSIFYVTYRADSIISRYLDTHESQLDDVNDALQEVINNKFVDTATGESLDRLGRLFGPTIGKRRGRDDAQYRIYLKSIVQSFVSRGTVNGIKLAISAATEVPIDNIEIREDFDEVEYEVVVTPETPVTIQLLEEVAEIADPSGVNQVRTRFVPEPDVTGIDEILEISQGELISENIILDDAAATFNQGYFEDIVIADATAIDPNHYDAATDTLYADDAFAIDPNHYDAGTDTTYLDDDAVATPSTAAFENIEIDDAVQNVEPSNKNAHRWEETSDPDVTTEWSFFEWTEIVELVQAASDTAFADDAVTIPPKDATTTDSALSNDTVKVVFNATNTTDIAYSDDTIATIRGDAVDTGGSDDTVVSSQTLVAWDTNDWNTLEWVQEHN